MENVGDNDPSGQSVHEPLPATGLYIPSGHTEHGPPRTPVYPALHTQSVISSLTAGEAVSAGHSSHSPDGDRKWFGRHDQGTPPAGRGYIGECLASALRHSTSAAEIVGRNTYRPQPLDTCVPVYRSPRHHTTVPARWRAPGSLRLKGTESCTGCMSSQCHDRQWYITVWRWSVSIALHIHT